MTTAVDPFANLKLRQFMERFVGPMQKLIEAAVQRLREACQFAL